MSAARVRKGTWRLVLGVGLGLILVTPTLTAGEPEPIRRPGRRPGARRVARAPFQMTRYAMSRDIVRAHPETQAERVFVEAFRRQLEDAIAAVVSNPQQNFAPGSLEAHLRAASLRLDGPTRAAVLQRVQAAQGTRRAAAAPAQPGGTRRVRPGGARRVPGGVARPPVVVRSTGSGMSADMRKLLRAAVRARLDHLFSASTTMAHTDTLQAIRTFVEVGYFSKEMVTPGTREITIHQPELLEFRWWTDEPKAQEGKWELLGPPSQKAVMAEGGAGDAPKRTFKVDLRKYLPAQPTATEKIYHLRVQAWTRPSITKVPGATPQSSEVVKKGAEHCGPWSQPVVIRYVKAPNAPEMFDFPKVYRKLRLRVHDLHLLEDQEGSGAEEYHVAGFVQEMRANGMGEQGWFGPFVGEMDSGGPYSFDIDRNWLYHLNNPDRPEWPRTFLFVASIVEEDMGDSLEDWLTGVKDAATTLLASEAYKEVVEFIEDYLEEHGEEVLEEIVQWGTQVAQFITAIASEVSATIVGIVVTWAAMIIAAIVSGSDDDYYGTEAYVLPLLTNRAEFVHGFSGYFREDGTYRLKRRIHFRGHTQYPQAMKYDGQVELRIRLDFSELVDLH